jgi:hypothetical protein
LVVRPPRRRTLALTRRPRCGRIWAAQPPPWVEVFVNVVRPPGLATLTQNPKTPFDEGVRTYERGAGVALLADEFVVGDVPPALGDRAVWRRSAVVRRPGLWFAFI